MGFVLPARCSAVLRLPAFPQTCALSVAINASSAHYRFDLSTSSSCMSFSFNIWASRKRAKIHELPTRSDQTTRNVDQERS